MGNRISNADGLESRTEPAPHSANPLHRAAVLEFVRTPFTVRRNVVKVWRSLPVEPWTQLSFPEDRAPSIRRERRAIAGVAVGAVLLVAGFSSIGLCTGVGEDLACFPLLGKSLPTAPKGSLTPGWYYVPGQSLSLALWVVVPSLAGWAFVRLIWLPIVALRRPAPEATLAFARHLSGVYLYVYAMVLVGAGLMPLLVLLSPKGSETLRWCLWCFLFCESFFVPAVMWSRLVINDSSGKVFGRFRYAALLLYMAFFVAIPIGGMIQKLD